MFFDEIKKVAPDPIFGIKKAFSEDPRAEKIDLSIGVFPTMTLKKRNALICIEEALQLLTKKVSFNYLPIDGEASFVRFIAEVVFGKELFLQNKERIYGAQCVGGTGGLRLLAEFCAKFVGKNVYLPNPTWPNHYQIFSQAGFNIFTYPYYDKTNFRKTFSEMIEVLQKAPSKSVVVLQLCGHNPSGFDLSYEEWRAISAVILKKKLFPIFDDAYQGFGDSLEGDRGAIELFLKEGHEMGIVFSCSKNFGLYGERVGAAFWVGQKEGGVSNLASNVQILIRGMYSNPPTVGAQLVATVFQNPQILKKWQDELSEMRHYIQEMKKAFAAKAEPFAKIKEQKGFFALLPLSEAQILRLRQEFGVYLLLDGRINLAGLTLEKLDFVVKSILAVL